MEAYDIAAVARTTCSGRSTQCTQSSPNQIHNFSDLRLSPKLVGDSTNNLHLLQLQHLWLLF